MMVDDTYKLLVALGAEQWTCPSRSRDRVLRLPWACCRSTFNLQYPLPTP